MRIPSGKTDQAIFFVAVDANDHVTRKTGLSAFTVYRSRNGAEPVAFTTPTVAELSAANMPGVYALLIDEDTTIAAGSDSEEMCLHITQAGMAPVTRTVELYRRDTTSGRTAALDAAGRVDVAMVAGAAQTARDLGAQLDVAVSTRLAGSGYTAPDNAGIAAIKAKTDNLPSDPADESLIIAATDALANAIAALPTTTTVNAIKSKTDSLTFGVAGKVDANITHVNEIEVAGDGAAGTEWGPA